MKKHVSLLLAVLMLLTSAGFNVIAAGEHTHFPDTDNPRIVNPTCDDMGYSEYLCAVPGCGEVLYEGNYKDPLGHTFSDDKYEEVEGGYNKYQECTRQYTINGKLESCKARSYETEDGKKTVYCKVTFVNNRVTDTYDSTIKYTNVADTFKEQELFSCYVKRGEAVEYEGLLVPYRDKTVEYGLYECLGWTTEDVEAKADKNLTEEDCVDLSEITTTHEGRDIVLYPVFAGLGSSYTVIFYNYDNDRITNPQTVDHGTPAKYSDPTGKLYPTPTKNEDIVNYYQFNGWSANMAQTVGVPNEVIEKTPIYGDAHFYPTFKPVAKRYTLEFYDEAGENLLKYNGADAVFENINLDTNFNTAEASVYADALNVSKTKLEKAGDKIYYYEWTGKWRVLRGDDTVGTIVNFNDFEVFADDIINEVDVDGNVVYLEGELAEGLTAKDEPDLEPSKIIRLVPVFERRLKVYTVDVEMQIPYGEDEDYYRGEAVVHVVANNNQLVASGRTDANGKFRCYLNYQTPFTVTVATQDSKYLGTATINELVNDSTGNVDNEAEINKCRVAMQLNPEYETHCSCIHHISLLQPIFVRILNILYTFFNVKYVCCYDMYSTIGPLLDYTAD